MDGRKRMLGNAIVPQVAAEILRAMMHALSLHNAQAHTRAGAETVAETTDTQTKNEL
jgi:hypothetical protein